MIGLDGTNWSKLTLESSYISTADLLIRPPPLTPLALSLYVINTRLRRPAEIGDNSEELPGQRHVGDIAVQSYTSTPRSENINTIVSSTGLADEL